jgi:DNA-binding MarR family transcriptional regulator
MTPARPDPAAVDDLRLAVSRLLGAERRVRGRDQQRPGQLSFAQVRALAALSREREMTAGQLARAADLNPASVTAMLDHLEAAEIVQRHRSDQDRRVCQVSLTPHGQQLLDRKLVAWQARWREKLADFDDAEIATAARVVSEIAELFDTIASAPESEAAAQRGASA